MTRGRKSAASLDVVSILTPGQGRPPPPVDLDDLEARLWRATVDSLPSSWIDQAGQLVLRRLVCQAAIAERREQRLRELRAQDQDNNEEAAKLAHMHGVACKTVVYLLTQLRATPRARLVSRDAGPAIEQSPKTFKPWEIRARG